MWRFVAPRWILALSLPAMLAACRDATLAGPNQPLAVGAYYPLGFGDGCGPSGKLPSPCLPQNLTEVLEARSEDPTIADVILRKDHPRPDVARQPYYVVGKKPGKTTLVFKGMFDDGSVREDSLDIRVESPDTFRLWPTTCYYGSTSTTLLASVGSTEGLYLEMLAGNEDLVGWLPDAVTADGLTDQFADNNVNSYTWQAPATPGVAQLQSSFASTIDGTLRAFAPDEVTEIDLGSPAAPAAFIQPGDVAFSTETRIDGQPTCQPQPIEVHTATPSICTGLYGATAWPGDSNPQGAHATVHAEGDCTLSVSVPGGPVLSTETFPVFFVQAPPAGIETPDYGVPCAVEGGTGCVAAYDDIMVCQGGQWVFKSSCAAGQTCDFVSDAAQGCVAGTSCAQCRGLH